METCNTLSAIPLTMTSREIAELTGKQHSHVLRDIRTMIAQIYDITHDPNMDHIDIKGVMIERDFRNYIASISLDKDHTLTLLTGYDAKARFKVIRRWQELEAAAALIPHPDAYRLSYQPAIEIQIFESAIRELRVSETSKIRMYAAFCKSKDINSDFLPDYVNEPQVKAITSLLKDMSNPLYHHVAKLVNPALEAMGILERLSRKSTGNKIKQFWSLTEEGLQYGRNETSPNNPRETQPLFFVACFPQLLMRLEAHRAGKLLPPAQ
ncbi:Rha family transcriptional regulator [Chromatium okenii]|uniref:Rha family transcriptional regulator n=1 Tax=Chromatium okenii TaxID=61644 RepID=UPI0026EB72A5|nr:Rha family transcriptional regulator [Chromatium okenii]MBV5309870.1 Rha family transcriptional regulator [Chromatium okenii]